MRMEPNLQSLQVQIYSFHIRCVSEHRAKISGKLGEQRDTRGILAHFARVQIVRQDLSGQEHPPESARRTGPSDAVAMHALTMRQGLDPWRST